MMDKQQMVAKAKALIANSEPEEALDLVSAFLQQDPKHGVLYREALRIAAFFNKTKKEEGRGTISFENAKLSYNQINDSLLNLIAFIENGDLNPEALTPPDTSWKGYYRSHKWQIITAFSTLLIALAALWWVYQNSQDNKAAIEDSKLTVMDCPFPQGDAFNIMLLRFFLPGGGDLYPEGLIAEQLESFCSANQIKAAIEIMKKPEKPDRLMDYATADTIGKMCKAKMVIWGRAEKNGTESEIKTRFKYLGTDGDIALSQIKWQGENQLGAEKTLSSLVSQGELFEDIEKVILLVQGIIATETDKTQLAMNSLENLDMHDSTALLVKGMVLAENYLKVGDNPKALATYDSVLNTHPDYWLARNNKGMLEMQQGDYLSAIEDLSAVIEKKPDNAGLLLARGRAFEMSEQLLPAREDYQKVVDLKAEEAPAAGKLLESAQLKIDKYQEIIEQVEQKDVRRRTAKDTLAIVEAHRSLGQNEQANKLVANSRITHPADPFLLAQQVETLLRQRKKAEAQKVVKDAEKTGVKKEEIAKKSKNLTVKRFLLKGLD
ncbi:MAG: tetratricopeptide repeat protein [Saprospiraceae bacterium]